MGKRSVTPEELNSDRAIEATCLVRRSFSKDGELVQEGEDVESIAVHRFITSPGEVEVSFDSVINMGNYESAKIHISCKVPAYREELDEAYVFAKTFADKKMMDELSDIRASRDKNKDHNPL